MKAITNMQPNVKQLIAAGDLQKAGELKNNV